MGERWIGLDNLSIVLPDLNEQDGMPGPIMSVLEVTALVYLPPRIPRPEAVW